VNEVDVLIEVVRQRFSTLPAPLDEIRLQSPAVKVIDCVLSLNRRYDRVVLPRVQQFTRKHPDIQALSQLRALIARYDRPLDFSNAELEYNDQRRALTLLGLVDYLLDVLQEHEGRTEAERLERWAIWARPGDYLAVGVPDLASLVSSICVCCSAPRRPNQMSISSVLSRRLLVGRSRMSKRSICLSERPSAPAYRYANWTPQFGRQACAATIQLRTESNIGGLGGKALVSTTFTMTKSSMEAFSNGVVAIIITAWCWR